MGRIPEAEIATLKAEISVRRLAESRGIALRKSGADWLGLCPFHDDREPSLVISDEKNLWHCLGACQAGGSAIDWVMRAEGVSFRHAVEWLRREGGAAPAAGELVASRPVVKRSDVKKLPLLTESLAPAGVALLDRVVAHYTETLWNSPEAREYLASRGLWDEAMVAHFRLGFGNRTLGYLVPDKSRKAGADLRGQLTELGIYRESGHEHFNGSLVVPIQDEAGAIVGMYGRKVTEGLRAGTPKHLYLAGGHRGVWNLAGVGEEVILCESLLDALTFWVAGYRNVTAAYGVEGFTPAHWEAFRARGVRRVQIAYDRDEAGDRAAERLSTELNAAGIETWRVVFPRGMDANEYALKVTPAKESLALVLRKATWMGKAKPVQDAPVSVAPRLPSFAAVAVAPAREAVPVFEPEPVASGCEVPAADEDAECMEATKCAVALSSPSASSAPSPAPAGGGSKEHVVVHGDRTWRARTVEGKAGAGSLRVNLLVRRESGEFFVDTVELYAARHRAAYVRQAAEELRVEEPVLKRELGALLLELEAAEEAASAAAKGAEADKAEPVMTDAEERDAMALLRAPDLLSRIVKDVERTGLVGEDDNKLLAYLAVVSRKLEAPLGVVIQSTSAAGKSSLMNAIVALVPEEERVSYSAMTGQALYYMGETDLRHKVLAIAEEEGASRASYALKLLQSEGTLTIASTGKDPATGKLVTHGYTVEGPVMIFLTTTAIDVDEELLNRCIVLTVDEGREQTRAIHDKQRESQTLEGLWAREERGALQRLHQNAQRLLRPLAVVNPYVSELSFLDHAPRTRRDHVKYLTLIRTIALVHQHQRVRKVAERDGKRVEYIEAERSDIEVAKRLLESVNGRSLDELPPATRKLLEHVGELVAHEAARGGMEARDVRFTRRQVREWTRWGQTQLVVHLGRLEAHEYLLAHHGMRGQRFVYELAYEGEPATGHGYDEKLSGQEAELSGGYRPAVGGISGHLSAPAHAAE